MLSVSGVQLRCPDCEQTLQPEDSGDQGQAWRCPACSRGFSTTDGIVYCLPASIADRQTKEREKQGWQAKSQYTMDEVRDYFLRLPHLREGERSKPYFDQAGRQWTIAHELLASLEGKVGLDLGGAFGWSAYRFTEQGARMVLCDYNDGRPSGLGGAEIYFETGIRFDRVCADAEALPFESEQFDFVCSCSFLHHLPNPARALQHIARILKPGGLMVANMEAFQPFWMSQAEALSRSARVEEFLDAGINEQVFHQRDYRRWFEEAGLQFQLVNPRWDRIAGRRIGWGAGLNEPGYVPEFLSNRAGRGGVQGTLARSVLRSGLWRMAARPGVVNTLRPLLLSATQKYRVLLGWKPPGPG